MKYRVYPQRVDSAVVVVEADSEEEAIEKSFEISLPSLCAKCSGWGQNVSVDEGEWDVPDVGGVDLAEDDEPVTQP